MSDKRKMIIILILMVLYIASSVFFCCIFKVWGVAWIILPFAVEYVIQCKKAKKILFFKIPKKIVNKPTAQEPAPPVNLINSISVLVLRDFIQCVCYKNLSVLGDGSPEQLQAAYIEILSQYYKAKSDDSVIAYIKLMREKYALELHKHLVNTIADIMREHYSNAGAVVLRRLYPKYQFTQESLLQDLSMVGKSEIRNSIKYDVLVKQLDKMQADRDKDQNKTPEQQQEEVIDTLMELRKYEGINYNINEITVLEFARSQVRYLKHVKNLIEHSHGR